jgi:hypothetical protein
MNDALHWPSDPAEIRKMMPRKYKKKGAFPLELLYQLYQNEQFEKNNKKSREFHRPLSKSLATLLTTAMSVLMDLNAFQAIKT